MAARVLRLVGRPDLVEQPWFSTGAGRVEHVEEIDEAVARWIGERDRDTVLAAFEAAEAAIAPVYDASDVLADPHLAAIGAIANVEGIKMPNVVARLSATPGEIRRAGGRQGEDTEAVLEELGVGGAELDALARGRSRVTVPPLTWLYVPADRPDRVEKALASAAHAVIVDLEDGVAPGAKADARANLASLLGVPREKPVYVRVNAGDADDLEAVAALDGLSGVLVPKVARPEDVPAIGLPVHCLIESAAGLEAAYAIASAPGVAGISLGESDLRSETGALEAGLDWARGRIVNAAVAAGLPRPPQSVYPQLHDDEGLARSCTRGRELGHLGRAAIHPAQLPIIEQAYLPTEEELERARATVERLEAAGAGTLGDGRSSSTPPCSARRSRLRPWPLRTERQHVQHQGGTHEEPAHTGARGLRSRAADHARALGRRLEQPPSPRGA